MIRFANTRTRRSVKAKHGRDLTAMVKIEPDRRSGIETSAQKQKALDVLWDRHTRERT